ncbi:MAG: hypothetical protein QNK23_05020 [Crocinitomicaceae bacterium]|nr:hypothetical protein [Crocinitomicaceae bacterium]
MKQVLAISFLSLLLFSSCKKDPTIQPVESATIRYYGDPAVDGCAWVVVFENYTFKAINLPENFKVDNLEVQVEYIVLDSWAGCGLEAATFLHIDITNIQ